MIPSQVAIKASTQEFLEIEDIRDDIVILRDGSCVLVLSTTAINFGLLSEQEQEAAIYAYAALLNSLNFPIQVLIRSKRKDITSYLKLLEDQIIKTPSKDLREQIRKYKKFVEKIVQVNQVLDKSFYVVIPMTSLETGAGIKSLSPLKKKGEMSVSKEYLVDKARTILLPKRDQVIRLLARLGLRSHQLTTQELIALFYEVYNPGAVGQIIASPAEYQASIVGADTEVKTSPDLERIVLEREIEPQVIDQTGKEVLEEEKPATLAAHFEVSTLPQEPKTEEGPVIKIEKPESQEIFQESAVGAVEMGKQAGMVNINIPQMQEDAARQNYGQPVAPEQAVTETPDLEPIVEVVPEPTGSESMKAGPTIEQPMTQTIGQTFPEQVIFQKEEASPPIMPPQAAQEPSAVSTIGGQDQDQVTDAQSQEENLGDLFEEKDEKQESIDKIVP